MLYQQLSDEVDREFLRDTFTRLLEPFVFDEASRAKRDDGVDGIMGGTVKYSDLHDEMELAYKCRCHTISERFTLKGGVLLNRKDFERSE
jgi:hypothetical protein